MAGVNITITGVEEVKRSLANIVEDIEGMASVHRDVSQFVAGKASAIAPRLTGNLASSIQATPTDKTARVTAGSNAIPYAGVQEYGWPDRNINAQPYLRPAVYDNITQIVAKYEDGIKEVIKKYD